MTCYNSFDPLSQKEYDKKWVEQTWGWDTPDVYIKTLGKNLRPRIIKSIEIANLTSGMNILDVGCGRGEVVLYCARKGIHATGVDYSGEVLDIAIAAKKEHSHEQQMRMTFVNGTIANIKNVNKYDRIFLLDFVEHLNDFELHNVLNKCHDLLKPSGYLVIHTLPNRWVYDITYGKLLRSLMPYLPKNPRSEKEKKIHINEMSIFDLHKTLDNSGFSSRIWLSDIICQQAKWHSRDPLKDSRGKIYKWLNNSVVELLYKICMLTPLKIFICNDIFAVAWKKKYPAPSGFTGFFIENFTLSILTKLKKY